MAFRSTAIDQITTPCSYLSSSFVARSAPTAYNPLRQRLQPSFLIKPAANLSNRPTHTTDHQKLAGSVVVSHNKCGSTAAALPRNVNSNGGAARSTSHASSHVAADPLRLRKNQKGLYLQRDHEEGQKLDGRGAAALSTQPEEEQLLIIEAELRLLANAASDRAEMHGILAQQRDNWNKLFQHTLTAASLTACVLSSLTNPMALSPAVPAFMLNAGTAAMMAIINQFQPSQLAEEQRTAVRLFSKVASDVEYMFQVAPQLRQHLPSFLRDCRRRMAALDKAFPMPLTPGGLEKFPSTVAPPALIEPFDHDDDHVVVSGITSCRDISNSTPELADMDGTLNVNGWDTELVHDLQHVAELLHHSDISKYTGWAQNLVKINKCLAVAAPAFAACATLLNLGLIVASKLSASAPNYCVLGMWAAICSVLAVFASSMSHDMQMGMVFELYRNSAGYYANVESSIKEALSMPVHERENGFLFRQRIAYQLGRQAGTSQHHRQNIVPEGAKEAGTLF